jgi:hypothetical protein
LILSSRLRGREDPGAGPCWIQDNPGSPGTEHHSQEPLIWSPIRGGKLSTYVNVCGSDAPIAVARPGNVNPGANCDGARGDGLTGPGVLGARCRVDRDRAAIRRFGDDCTTIHARHSQCFALAPCSRRDSQSLRAIGVTGRGSKPLGVIGATRREARGLGAIGCDGCRAQESAYPQGEHEGEGKAPIRSHLRPSRRGADGWAKRVDAPSPRSSTGLPPFLIVN